MKKIAFIDPRICERKKLQCSVKKNCPQNAVYVNREGFIKIDDSKCSGCMICLELCQMEAVKEQHI